VNIPEEDGYYYFRLVWRHEQNLKSPWDICLLKTAQTDPEIRHFQSLAYGYVLFNRHFGAIELAEEIQDLQFGPAVSFLPCSELGD
jgi:hypothetical protein